MRRTVSITLGGAALLAAGVLAGCMSGGADDADSATTSAPAATSQQEERPASPMPPSSFDVEAAPFQVILTWEAPDEGAERFELFRDSVSLAVQPGSSTSYTDTDVEPGRVYDYEIASGNGELVSGRLHESVETPVPPLRAARLAGTFNITTRFRSKSGYGGYTRPNFGWRFVPRCDDGPCAVVAHDIHEQRFRLRLKRRGKRYAGTYTGPFTIQCEGNRSTSTVDVDLRVVRAAALDGEWLATQIRGTIEQSETAQFGCRPAEATLAFRGSLPR